MRSRAVVLAATLALVAVACGTSDDGGGVASADQLVAAGGAGAPDTGDAAGIDGAPPAAEGDVDVETALLAFTACMREEGVDMPDPGVDAEGNLRLEFRGMIGGDIDRETMQAARAACAGLLEGVAQRFDQVDRTQIEDQLLAFAQCMRDNGVDMPDPDFGGAPGGPGGGGPGGGPFGQLDPNDPEFQAASEVCQSEFGDLRFGPGGGGRPGPGPGGPPDDGGAQG